MYCIGIDVGGTTVKLGLFTEKGELKKKWEIKSRLGENGKVMLEDIASSVRDTLKAENIPEKDITGIGMGVPGPVQPDGFVEVCVNLHWKDKYPAKELSGLLDNIPVKLSNDANVAALGETWQGAAKGYSDVVLLTLGTGIGGGIVINGKIINGRHGLGGEIGHIHVRDSEKEYCNCGGQGCLEQISSATGIAREARRIMEANDTDTSMRKFGNAITAKDVCDCAKAGDDLANRVMETVCRYLGLAISHAALIVDPDVFVIGGGVSKAGTFLTDMITRYYDYYTPISKHRGKVILAKLGNDAGIYGCARLALQEM